MLAREDCAVFLEDDCVPEPTFFRFCDEILEQYRDDTRVSQVCGNNRLIEWKADRQSYHFAYYGSAWGWATWRRAWAWFDPLLASWENPALRARIEARLGDAQEYRYFADICTRARRDPFKTWDYAWAFAQIAHDALTVVPSVNLVNNIGFGSGATHTVRRPLPAVLESRPMTFPLRPPPSMARDAEYDHKHFLWALGRPDAASAADFGRRLLLRGQAMEALVLVDATWRADPGRPISHSSAPRHCWRSGGPGWPPRFCRGSSRWRPATRRRAPCSPRSGHDRGRIVEAARRRWRGHRLTGTAA